MEIIEIRKALVLTATRLLGIPYQLGAEWMDYTKAPEHLDCSELIEGVYKINSIELPDGSQNQFNFTKPTDSPQIGDLAFFGKSKSPREIYHVGMLYDDKQIIEARAFEAGRDWTGKVILRDRKAWEGWKNFAGYRVNPHLLGA